MRIKNKYVHAYMNMVSIKSLLYIHTLYVHVFPGMRNGCCILSNTLACVLAPPILLHMVMWNHTCIIRRQGSIVNFTHPGRISYKDSVGQKMMEMILKLGVCDHFTVCSLQEVCTILSVRATVDITFAQL